MHSTSPLNTVKYAVMVVISPGEYSSLVDHPALPATSGAEAKLAAHFMPKRLWSRVASWLMDSPWPDSAMIWAMVQPAGCPYSSWAADGLLDHLVGDVGRKALHGALLVLGVPEPEERRYHLAHEEGYEHEGDDTAEDPARCGETASAERARDSRAPRRRCGSLDGRSRSLRCGVLRRLRLCAARP